jgi:ribonuclease D
MSSASSISREDMMLLPVRRHQGRVYLVATPEDFANAAADIRAEPVVGLDTETRPAFAKGESYLPCLVQVATAQAVYLFQLRRPECMPLLTEMLESPRIVKAGVALAYDLARLKLVLPFAEQAVVDLGKLARRAGAGQTGLRNLAGMYLGFRIPKGSRTSNWAAPRLSEAQVAYAATDAWACRELYLRFQELGLLEPV